ncbi:hypothetical protein PTNB85_10499 [Pyrenophora teres f. teres]|nr:hypothetical protein PTNB85_10499 [Pyrenophora teres f. teres]
MATRNNSALFSPEYLVEALCEIGCSTRGMPAVIPGTIKELNWWQIIATKFFTELFRNWHSPHNANDDREAKGYAAEATRKTTLQLFAIATALMGGILADGIGLGKTIEAIACIAKAYQYHEQRMKKAEKDRNKRLSENPELIEPGEDSRPSLYLTLSTLVPQTAEEVKRHRQIYNEVKDAWLAILANYGKTFSVDAMFRNVAVLPDRAPKSWDRNIEGRFSFVLCDECQENLRNENRTFRVIRWLHPLQFILMSGYPAPRGMKDHHVYMKLMKPGEDNPFLRADDDPNSFLRLHPSLFQRYILGDADSKSKDASARIVEGYDAQRTLAQFMIRRTFDTAIPPGNKKFRIGNNLPHAFHYTVERLYSPSVRRHHTNFTSEWHKRLVTAHKTRYSTKPVPSKNSRAVRAVESIEFFPPCGSLHRSNEVPPRPDSEEDVLKMLADDPQVFNKDQQSWFFDPSDLANAYESIRKTASYEPSKGRLIRWLLQRCRDSGVTEIENKD